MDQKNNNLQGSSIKQEDKGAAPLTKPSEARKPLVIALVSLGAVIVLVLLIFLAPTFVGKAFLPGVPNTAGVEDQIVTVGSSFNVPIKANIGLAESVAMGFSLGFDTDELAVDCTAVNAALQAYLDSISVFADAFDSYDLSIVKEVSCDATTGTISLNYGGLCDVTCSNAIKTTVSETLVEIPFTAIAVGEATLSFSSFNIVDLTTHKDLISGNGLGATITVEAAPLECVDADGDGYNTTVSVACGTAADQDCDDANENCTTDCTTDADVDTIPDCADTCIDIDGDSYGTAGGSGDTCLGTDCNDAAGTVNPGATEACNGIDDNCDNILDGVAVENDTCITGTSCGYYGNACTAVQSCMNGVCTDCPTGSTGIPPNCDCTPNNYNVATNTCTACTGTPPANADLCPGDSTGLTVNTPINLVAVCNTQTPDVKCEYNCTDDYQFNAATNACEAIPTACIDTDEDGYNTTVSATCGTAANQDCDDANNLVWQNISGYYDTDHDGYGNATPVIVCTNGTLPTGYAANSNDCNDSNATVNVCGAGTTCQAGACVPGALLVIELSEEATGTIRTAGIDALAAASTYQIKVTATPTASLPANHLIIGRVSIGEETKSIYWSNMPALAANTPENVQFTYQIPPGTTGNFTAKAFVWNGWLAGAVFDELIPPVEANYTIS